ncbi:MAG: chemotaxis protein CheA [Campylobacterales bacterium]|nr:chemotaxis protein CheA [Campylobacterales bacterium]
MATFDISKYREMFLVEAEELFSNMEDLLLEIERERHLSDEHVQELFRTVHTLKGGAASVEYKLFTKLVHEFETFLDKLRNKVIFYEEEMAELFIECGDTLKELFELETNDSITDDEYQALSSPFLVKFSSYLNGDVAKLKPKEKIEVKEKIKEESPANSFGMFHDNSHEGKFGFFDVPLKDNDNKSKNEEFNFGFFDDEETSSPSANSQSDGSFGLFHDEPNVETNFGFFDEVVVKPSVFENSTVSKSFEEKKNSVVVASVKDKKDTLSSSSTIRVDLTKIDALMNNIGELVIATSMLYQYTENIDDNKIKHGFFEKIALIDRFIRELQESVMSTRMVPMENIYSKFPKTIRDISKKLDKKIEFKSYGNSVEIDKAMIEGLTDPLMHIIRNSCDHGIESPSERVASGKSDTGTITIGAEQSNGQIVITIIDDGKGIDVNRVARKAIERGVISEERFHQMSEMERLELIFEPGLSTATEITDVSGRGVGMDVVKTNISKLGGSIKIESEKSLGTKIIIALPLTLAILDGLNIAIGDSRFILPLASIVESLQPTDDMIKRVGDGSEEFLMIREEVIPIIRLHKIFNVQPRNTTLKDGILIIVKSGIGKSALFVDEFLNQQQVVIKPIDKNFKSIQGVSGATVRGDGSIGLILDVIGIVELNKQSRRVA